MSPRRYEMRARGAAVEATRGRIVEAAKQLHAEKGALATGWDEIATRAGVSPATVYRHFPSLESLVPACAASVFRVIGLPTPKQAAEIFRGITSPRARIERLIRSTCECYARGEGWLHAARREEELIPPLARAVALQRESLRVLIRAALAGRRASTATTSVLLALSDFPFWKSLKDAGLSDAMATDKVAELVGTELRKHGIT